VLGQIKISRNGTNLIDINELTMEDALNLLSPEDRAKAEIYALIYGVVYVRLTEKGIELIEPSYDQL